MQFHASAQHVWHLLMFYEQVDAAPPLILRLLLPVPIRTEGRKSCVGDEVRCIYRSGHLVKRITDVDPNRRYAFQVTEQSLDVGGGLRLLGGEYALQSLAPDRTLVTAVTRYQSPKSPRWFWRPIEAAVCHAFHRHILRAMRRGVRTPATT
jgi:hypothetical protein